MQDQQGHLEFFSNGSVIILGMIIVVITGVLCVFAWHRSGYRKRIGWLELLRFVLVCLVVITLNQPEWLESQPPEQRSTLAVLWDKSNSMQTQDVLDDQNTTAKRKSRAETIQPLISEKVWKSPDDTELNVVFEPFSSLLDPAEEATDINAGLARVLENHTTLRGVVLLSDGDWNIGNSPVEAATRFHMKGVPVYTVGVGSEVPLPDLELVSMDVPTYGVTKKQLRIPFVVRNTIGQDREVNLTLSIDDKSTFTKVITVPAMGQAQDNMSWTAKETGDYTLTIRITPDMQELIPENNELSASISVREEQLKVLVIDAYPRWEYRYLRNALERDAGVDVTCLLFHPKLPQLGGGRGYIKRFPDARALSKFDVVFLGDIGIIPNQLTTAHAQELRQLVSAQAAGIVFLPGRTGAHHSLTTGPLADLYPVILDSATLNGVGSSIQGYFTLTEFGQRSLLTRLGDTDLDNSEAWRALPGFSWYAGVKRAKVGT